MVLRHWVGRQRFGRLRRRKLERAARRSQARRYPGDWVFERIDGDGETFDFGIDYTECGIVKYLHAQGADELCPYGCDRLCHVRGDGDRASADQDPGLGLRPVRLPTLQARSDIGSLAARVRRADLRSTRTLTRHNQPSAHNGKY